MKKMICLIIVAAIMLMAAPVFVGGGPTAASKGVESNHKLSLETESLNKYFPLSKPSKFIEHKTVSLGFSVS